MTKNQIIRDPAKACSAYLKLMSRAKGLYVKADLLLEQILEVLPEGVRVALPDGVTVAVVDRFKDKTGKQKNTAFKAASIKHYDVEAVK